MLSDNQKHEALAFAVVTIDRRMTEHRKKHGEKHPAEEWIHDVANEVLTGMVDIVDGWCVHPETGQQAASLGLLLELQVIFIEARDSLQNHLNFVEEWT